MDESRDVAEAQWWNWGEASATREAYDRGSSTLEQVRTWQRVDAAQYASARMAYARMAGLEVER